MRAVGEAARWRWCIGERARALGLVVLAVANVVPVALIATTPAQVHAHQGNVRDADVGAHARDAAAHADARPTFEAGDRVRSGFTPRGDDRWPVGGRRPVALPAGRLSGREMLDGRSVRRSGRDAVARAGSSARIEPQPSSSAALGQPPAAASWPGDRTCATIYPEPTPSGTTSRREVFGYLPYWELYDAASSVDLNALSTIAYFGVEASRYGRLVTGTSSGGPNFRWAGWNSSTMTRLIERAHDRGARVVLTVQRFAWSRGGAAETTDLLTDPARRARLATEIAAAVRDRGADGVDLDFEPMPLGLSDEYTEFVREVRAALDTRAQGYQLTFTIPIERFDGDYDLPGLLGEAAADAVFVMGYEYRDPMTGVVSSIAPLTADGCSLSYTVGHLLSLVPPEKVILGLPYYGRSWPTVDGSPGASVIADDSTTIGFSASTVVLHGSAVARARTVGRRYVTEQESARLRYRERPCSTCAERWRQTYYDDLDSLAAKYALVEETGLRGTGVWALGYEGGPELSMLQRAIFRGKRDADPPKGTVTIADGHRSTPSVWVDVDVPATDGTGGTGLAYVRLSRSPELLDGVLAQARVFPYTRAVRWRLTAPGGSPAPGSYTVYVQWRDVFGNWSAVQSDSIRYAP